jgi:hypothetical protein
MMAVRDCPPNCPVDIARIYERIEGGETWRAEHDGRINAYWEQQFRLNAKLEAMMTSFDKRLTAVERRVFWVSGFAAGIGSLIGVAISHSMGSI